MLVFEVHKYAYPSDCRVLPFGKFNSTILEPLSNYSESLMTVAAVTAFPHVVNITNIVINICVARLWTPRVSPRR